MWLLLAECHLTNWGDSPFRPGVVSDNQLDTVGDFKRCIQLCSTTPVTAHRQMLLRRMFCGGLLISPHPVAAHHSTSSSATLNSRRHCYSRGSPRPEVWSFAPLARSLRSRSEMSIAVYARSPPPA